MPPRAPPLPCSRTRALLGFRSRPASSGKATRPWALEFPTRELCLAIRGRRLAQVRKLLWQHRGTPLAGGSLVNSPLHWAARAGDPDIMAALLAHLGARVNIPGRCEETPLHVACLAGHADVVRVLVVEPGLAVNRQDISKRTALHLACLAGHAPVVDLLLTCPWIDLGLRDLMGNTPLHYAALNGTHPECVWSLLRWTPPDNFLLRMGRVPADPNAANQVDMTPLHYACRGTVDLHTPVDLPDEGMRPGTPSTQYGHNHVNLVARALHDRDTAPRGPETVQLLLALPNVRPHAYNCLGQTCLHRALQNGLGMNLEVLLDDAARRLRGSHTGGPASGPRWGGQHPLLAFTSYRPEPSLAVHLLRRWDVPVPPGHGALQNMLNIAYSVNNLEAVRLLLARATTPFPELVAPRALFVDEVVDPIIASFVADPAGTRLACRRSTGLDVAAAAARVAMVVQVKAGVLRPGQASDWMRLLFQLPRPLLLAACLRGERHAGRRIPATILAGEAHRVRSLLVRG